MAINKNNFIRCCCNKIKMNFVKKIHVFLLFPFILVSCNDEKANDNSSGSQPIEKSISYIDSKRVSYTTDDTFDDYVCNGGLNVVVEYQDSTEKILSKDEFSWSIKDSSFNSIDTNLPFDDIGTYTVTITHNNFNVSYYIEVSYGNDVKLSSIIAENYTSEVKTGSFYSFDGTITAFYSDGTSKNVSDYATFSNIDTTIESEQKLFVSYKEGRITKTIEITIFVSNDAEEKRANEIKLLSPVKGQFVDAYDQRYNEYLNASNEADIVSALEKYSLCNPKGKTVELKWNLNGSSSYTLHIAFNDSFLDEEVYILGNTTNFYLLDNLIPSKRYYWKVVGTKDNDYSKTNYFDTNEGIVRFINAGNVQNIRDMGGWATSNNKKIKYGLIYRGNCLNGYAGLSSLDLDGKNVFNNKLKIKTELDLRTQNIDDNNQTSNFFNSEKPYIKATISQYTYVLDSQSFNDLKNEKGAEFVGNGSPNLQSASSLKTIFETFANKDSFPIYMHCNVGADRTGTLSLLLGGVLGVSYDDLMKNYELTSFYSASGKRYRSAIKDGLFDKNSIYKSSKDGNFIAMQVYYDALMKYHSNGGNFQNACENFLKSFAGISDQTIENVKNNILN